MPFPFVHITGAWLPAKIAEKLGLTITRLSWFFIIFGAIFPDIDYIPEWMFGMPVHRTLTHSIAGILLFGMALTLLSYILRKICGKPKFDNPIHLGLAFSFGILIHILLDLLVPPISSMQLFWPLHYSVSIAGIASLQTSSLIPSLQLSQLSDALFIIRMAILDMAVGLLFGGYLFFTGKLERF